MKHLDLFSGIGGFALAARWAGFETIGFCEIDKYCQKVLKKNFPDVPIYEDVTKLKGNQFKDIFLITGGFPCQDISLAGKGAGIEGKKSGLWSELFRIIGEVRPKFALIENVPALTIRGGPRVIADLTSIGYDTEWQIVGADDVGAPHRRKRIWIVANSNSGFSKRENKGIFTGRNSADNGSQIVANTDSKRGCSRKTNREDATDVREPSRCEEHREGFTLSNLGGMVDGVRTWMDEPDIPRVTTGEKNRIQRLKGLGNAIVPQVAYEIMKGIYDTNN